jgi:hypothetical protein
MRTRGLSSVPVNESAFRLRILARKLYLKIDTDCDATMRGLELWQGQGLPLPFDHLNRAPDPGRNAIDLIVRHNKTGLIYV